MGKPRFDTKQLTAGCLSVRDNRSGEGRLDAALER